MAETKSRRVRKADWDKVEKYVQGIYDERKNSSYRREHEMRWNEVDRQIRMEQMRVKDERGRDVPPGWHNVMELGELSKASEIIASDVMRIAFPTDKAWFQPHVSLDWPTGPNGQKKVDSARQKVADGLLRSLMNQQHIDFGFKNRFRLSVKEALHHGSMPVEIRMENRMMVKDGGLVKPISAPVWHPYSMWNAFPDPSPAVLGSDLFYNGSMIFVDYMPKWKLKDAARGPGWMRDRLEKVKETKEHQTKAGKTKDIELLKFYVDIAIERQDGDLLLPNSKVILANGTLVFWDANELPFPSVIYAGYERQDVRDPYYTSPIIKQSPVQKFSTVVANKFLDATSLKVEPPIEYDGNDPDYVANDGPVIAPGAKTPTKSMGRGMQALDIGQPDYALKALEFGLRQMQEGTGVSAPRSGVNVGDRATAFEVNKVAQGAEVRTVEFISNLEPALRSFLYMQHELNRKHLTDTEFYNDEMHTPDVVQARRRDIQANAYFEVVGARGLLGEEQRTQRISQVTAFLSSNPLFAGLLKTPPIAMDMYRDAGKKNPEDFVKADGQMSPADAQAQAQLQQAKQIIQQLSEEVKKLQDQHQEKMVQMAQDAQSNRAKLEEDRRQFNVQLAEQRDEFLREQKLAMAELLVNLSERFAMAQGGEEAVKVIRDLEKTITSQSGDLAKSAKTIQDLSERLSSMEQESKKPRRRTGTVKAPSGKTYNVDIKEGD